MRGRRLSVAIVAAISGTRSRFRPRGAAQPASSRQAAEAAGVTDQDREHWAFQKVHRPACPALARPSDAGPNADRRLSARAAWQEKNLDLSPAGRQADSLAAGVSRSGRPSAQPEEVGRLRGRPVARRVCPPGRSPAGFAAVRRALGPALARRRRLCRHGRLRHRRQQHHLERRQVEVPRLRDRRLQRRQALRPVPHRATRRRRAGRLAARPAFHAGNPRRPDRDGLPPHGPRSDARAGEQYPAQLLRRAPRHGRDAGKQPVRASR